MNTITFVVNDIKITVREAVGRDVIARPTLHHILATHENVLGDATDASTERKHNLIWSGIVLVSEMILRTTESEGIDVPTRYDSNEAIIAFYDSILNSSAVLLSRWQEALRDANAPKKTD